MKMLLTILRDNDTEPVSQALVEAGFRVTRSASTGGFLRRGMTTLIIGVADEKVDEAIASIRQRLGPPSETADSHRAVIFVMDVENFQQI